MNIMHYVSQYVGKGINGLLLEIWSTQFGLKKIAHNLYSKINIYIYIPR